MEAAYVSGKQYLPSRLQKSGDVTVIEGREWLDALRLFRILLRREAWDPIQLLQWQLEKSPSYGLRFPQQKNVENWFG